MNNAISNKFYRKPSMHFRDRILYCRPFLRLAGKTQVYGTNFNDHTRTRLTHSLEVAQIARTMSIGLNQGIDGDGEKIDEYAVEAIALGHDLGHTPFGHAGEEVLHEILTYRDEHILDILFNEEERNNNRYIKITEQNKGFKHNWQSIRLLKDLCRDYIGGCMFSDLPKTTSVEIMKGILCHSKLCSDTFKKEDLSFYENSIKDLDLQLDSLWDWKRSTSNILCQIVYWADEIAQRHHDIEDAISFNFLTTYNAMDIIWKGEKDGIIYQSTDQRLNDLGSKSKIDKYRGQKEIFLKKISSIIVDYLVRDLVDHHEQGKQLEFSRKANEVNEVMDQRIKNIVLNSRNVQRMDNRGQYIIKKLFMVYAKQPLQMPNEILNSVFREYLCQYAYDGTNQTAIKELLNNSVDLFNESNQCRTIFDKCYKGESIKLYLHKYRDNENIYKPYFLDFNEKIIGTDSKLLIDDQDTILFKICLMRVIADHIAGMTDRYAEEEYHKLYGITHDIQP